MYYRILTTLAHRKTFSGTKTVIESRIKLECEREQQEQLLLSVIPAYIAAEVSYKNVSLHDRIRIFIAIHHGRIYALNFSLYGCVLKRLLIVTLAHQSVNA